MATINQPGVTYTGPLFDGTSLQLIASMMRDMDDAMGEEAVDLVHNQLDQNLQNPTGFYRSQIEFKRTTKGITVDDSDVIYGNWLEGTGSRNQTTKFKGYASFRKAVQQLNAQTTQVIQPVVDRYVAKLNGK